jgi:hypothetical protein
MTLIVRERERERERESLETYFFGVVRSYKTIDFMTRIVSEYME